MEKMSSRERVRRAIRKQIPDRVPQHDSLWAETVSLWEEQGHLPKNADVLEFFSFDLRLVHFDSGFMIETEDLGEDEEFITRKNSYGAVARFKKSGYVLAEMLDYPIKNRADWDTIKGRLTWHPDRFALTGFYSFNPQWTPPDQNWTRKMAGVKKYRDSGYYLALYMYDVFEATWRKLGHERAFMMMLQEPGWMREMFEAQIDLLVESYTEMMKLGIEVDGFFMASDIALKTGMMFSPRAYRELCFPCLKRLCDFLHANGVDMIFHCDGDFREVLPFLIEAGVDCIQPLEVHAGMDVRELKPKFGRDLAFMGNIGHDEMLLPDDEMESLIAEKVTVAKEGGGYIYYSDHSVPPDIPFEKYSRVLELVRKYGGYST